jgi:hypothetical protein
LVSFTVVLRSIVSAARRQGLTCSNHFNAFSGRLYFLAWARRSSANVGKTASKASRLVVVAILLVLKVSWGYNGIIFEPLFKQLMLQINTKKEEGRK